MMALIRDLFLWAIISFHIVGGAVLFKRYFPRESPWFGFLVPAIALVLMLNFIEHFLALPSLLWLLPFTLGGLIAVIARGGYSWTGLGVPISAFLLAFAFTFGVRCINPNILTSSDGLTDLSMMLNYCHGEKIPPTDNWLPTMDYRWYYSFQHYGASVLKRLLNVDGGTAYNAAHALLSAFTAFAGAAVAFRVSGGKAWIALVTVLLIEAAFTGSSAYIWLFMDKPSEFLPDNLSGGFDLRNNGNPLWHLLGYDTGKFFHGDDGVPMRRELQVSGFWTWRDEFHANSSGHFFTLFSVFTVIELLRRERANVPWICAVMIPPLVVITTAWLTLIDGILCVGALAIALALRRQPGSWLLVGCALAAGLAAVWPTFSDLTTAPQGGAITWNHPEWRTPFWEFVVQWWPVILLWLATFFFREQLPMGARWVQAAIPLFVVGIEFFNLEDDRYNTYEKMWGPVYSAGLVCFFGAVAARRGIGYRILTIVILACGMISMSGWLYAKTRWLPTAKEGMFNFQGTGYLTNDGQKARILQVLSQLRGATILTGHIEWNYSEPQASAVFSGNRAYMGWTFSEDRFGHEGEGEYRAKLNNDFYAGNCADPLGFLTANNVAAAVIWPTDKIPDDLVAKLKTALAPTYQYDDCRQGGANNAGVFLRLPLPVIKR